MKRESNCVPITICSSQCIVTFTVDTKMNSTHFWLMVSLCVKFHDDRCNGRQLWDRNILPNQASTDRRIDGQCDSSITPANFVAGYNNNSNCCCTTREFTFTSAHLWSVPTLNSVLACHTLKWRSQLAKSQMLTPPRYLSHEAVSNSWIFCSYNVWYTHVRIDMDPDYKSIHAI